MTDRWQDIKEFYSVPNQAGDDTLFLVKGKFVTSLQLVFIGINMLNLLR